MPIKYDPMLKDFEFYSPSLGVNLMLSEYLKKLLYKVWKHGTIFDPHKPFGAICWQNEIYAGMITNGIIEGTLDDNEEVSIIDINKADMMILKYIRESL